MFKIGWWYCWEYLSGSKNGGYKKKYVCGGPWNVGMNMIFIGISHVGLTGQIYISQRKHWDWERIKVIGNCAQHP